MGEYGGWVDGGVLQGWGGVEGVGGISDWLDEILAVAWIQLKWSFHGKL